MDRAVGTISTIKSLGYLSRECVSRCQCDELPCPLLSWLCGQLRLHCPELKDGGGGLVLAAELKSLLVDMSSPLADLTYDDSSAIDKITDYFISELQAALINKHEDSHSEEKNTETESPKEQRCVDLNPEEPSQEYEESTVSANKQAEWMLILKALNMDTNSDMNDVLEEVQLRLSSLPSDASSPLLSSSLSPEQWLKLEKINEVLSSDYKYRRQMMVKRFQVTLESFAWGDKDKERKKVLETIPSITSLDSTSNVSVSLVLAARVDLSFIEPIRPGKTTTVYKVKMGEVPDRGGRPGEIEPPMPLWESRKSGNRSGRGGGGRGHKGHKFGDRKKKKH